MATHKRGQKRIMVAGKFDPLHEGHIQHILQAADLGDELIIVTHKDEVIKQVREKEGKSAKCYVTFKHRLILLDAIIEFFGINGKLVTAQDDDGTCVKTIKYHKPDIYAKGGDRTPGNMLRAEVQACTHVGCEIVYGVGEQLHESSKIMGCQCEGSNCCSAS